MCLTSYTLYSQNAKWIYWHAAYLCQHVRWLFRHVTNMTCHCRDQYVDMRQVHVDKRQLFLFGSNENRPSWLERKDVKYIWKNSLIIRNQHNYLITCWHQYVELHISLVYFRPYYIIRTSRVMVSSIYCMSA